MGLELTKPDDELYDDRPLSLVVIQEFHIELEAYIDKRVAELHKLHPNLPLVMLRRDTIKGECLCAVAQRLLKETQP